MKGRFDFSVVPKRTANYLISQNENILIVADFGPQTLFHGFKLVYSSDEAKKRGFWKNIKVGLSSFSTEQYWRTIETFEKYDPIWVNVSYDNLKTLILEGKVDVTLRAIDLIEPEIQSYPTITLTETQEMSNAVLIVDKGREDIAYLIKHLIDIDKIRDIQNKVITNQMVAEY